MGITPIRTMRTQPTNEEAEQAEGKSEKREVERERERVEIKIMCLDRLSSNVFEVNKGIIDCLWRVEMMLHWPKSDGRQIVDLDLGGVSQSSSRRLTGGSGTRQKTSLQEGSAANVALFSKEIWLW